MLKMTAMRPRKFRLKYLQLEHIQAATTATPQHIYML